MKKITLIFAMLVPFFGFSQFVLTPNGFVDEKDETKNHLVYEFEGKTTEEIYTNILATLTNIYKSAKDVLNVVENKTIVANGIETVCETKTKTGCFYHLDLNYRISIDFKNNKIRISSPRIDLYDGLRLVENRVFNKKGKLRNKQLKIDIEDFTNELINRIVKSVDDKNDEW